MRRKRPSRFHPGEWEWVSVVVPNKGQVFQVTDQTCDAKAWKEMTTLHGTVRKSQYGIEAAPTTGKRHFQGMVWTDTVMCIFCLMNRVPFLAKKHIECMYSDEQSLQGYNGKNQNVTVIHDPKSEEGEDVSVFRKLLNATPQSSSSVLRETKEVKASETKDSQKDDAGSSSSLRPKSTVSQLGYDSGDELRSDDPFAAWDFKRTISDSSPVRDFYNSQLQLPTTTGLGPVFKKKYQDRSAPY